MKNKIILATLVLAVLLGVFVVFPWHARRVAGIRYTQMGQAFDSNRLAACDFVAPASLGDLAETLRGNVTVLHAGAEPSSDQYDKLAQRLQAFLAFYHRTSAAEFPAFRFPHAAKLYQRDQFDPMYVEELEHPEVALALSREAIEEVSKGIPEPVGSEDLEWRIRLNFALRVKLSNQVGGRPCTNCIQAVCGSQIRLTVAKSVSAEPVTGEILRMQPTYGSAQSFKQLYMVRPNPEDLVAANGNVVFAYVTLLARSSAQPLPLAVVYYWEPGREDWVLCEIAKGNSTHAASFIF